MFAAGGEQSHENCVPGELVGRSRTGRRHFWKATAFEVSNPACSASWLALTMLLQPMRIVQLLGESTDGNCLSPTGYLTFSNSLRAWPEQPCPRGQQSAAAEVPDARQSL